MPAPVACPTCGVDGTPKANAILAQMPIAMSGAITPIAMPMAVAAPAAVAVPAMPPAMAQLPPPIPHLPPPVAVPAAPPGRPAPRPAMMAGRLPPPKPARGKDGWNAPETGLNKLGSYLASGPAILAALIAWRVFGFEVEMTILVAVVAVFGVIGGILNVLGRGPIWAGACVGLVTALGGFGATCWWIHGRERAYKIELVIAFAIGCAPGIGLQYLLQRLVRRNAA